MYWLFIKKIYSWGLDQKTGRLGVGYLYVDKVKEEQKE